MEMRSVPSEKAQNCEVEFKYPATDGTGGFWTTSGGTGTVHQEQLGEIIIWWARSI